MLSYIKFQFVDFVDIFLVAILIYEVYRMIKGTVGMTVFLGITAFYVIWLVVSAFHMDLLSGFLGQFFSFGGVVLIVLFQSEIRKFFSHLGDRYIHTKSGRRISKLFNLSRENISSNAITELANAMFSMSKTQTGALIVLSSTKDRIKSYIPTGEILDAQISNALLQNIFFKNTPLHDGAVMIVGSRIVAAKCVLPMTKQLNLPMNFGMRHRSALGMSEETDTLVLVVSEQTGKVSCFSHGEHHTIETKEELISLIEQSQSEK